jgi:PAB-dependent poly(A)-specific ribonuclease subunit 3
MVTNRDDGHLYCLRRYDNCRAASGNKVAAAVMERWGNPRSGGGAGAEVQNHPGIVPLVTCFVAQRAFFFVHRLVPGARTLYERLQALRNPQRYHPYAPSNNSGQLLLLPESLLWSCLSQLVSALAAIHGVGLAVRSLDARHVLVTELPPPPRSSADIGGGGRGSASEGDRWRVRINCAGVMEALESETRRHVYEWQQLDLRALGRLVLSMATAGTGRGGALDDGTTSALQSNHAEAEAVLAQNYSRELHNLVMTLLQSGKQLSGGSIGAHRLQHHPNASVPAPSPSIRDVSRALWLHSQAEADRAYRDLDRVEYSLASEYDSSRTLRLLLKLGYVNDRPEFGPNRRWAQSGDCYVLSLFRDYGTLSCLPFRRLVTGSLVTSVLSLTKTLRRRSLQVFHQADGGGYPIMDLGHVITALNKLDAADPEKIVLASRDGISVMVVSFGDVARCLESAFHELCAGGVVVAPPSTLPY